MITMTQITDCIFLSLFWLLGCVPLVTVGASSSALYDAVYHGFRRGDTHPWRRFLVSFTRNLLAGVGPTVVYLILLGCGGNALVGLWNAAVAGGLSWGVFAGASFVGVLVFGCLSVLFPLLSRFENPFGVLLKNTVLLSLANLPRTLALGVLNAASGLMCAFFVVPLFFLPSLAALIGSVLIEPMFKPYIPSEDAA
jgi:uncharacterized membrane protein YesL